MSICILIAVYWAAGQTSGIGAHLRQITRWLARRAISRTQPATQPATQPIGDTP